MRSLFRAAALQTMLPRHGQFQASETPLQIGKGTAADQCDGTAGRGCEITEQSMKTIVRVDGIRRFNDFQQRAVDIQEIGPFWRGSRGKMHTDYVP